MKISLIASTLAIALLGAGLVANSVACSGGNGSGEDVSSGAISAAVTTIGPDGALYSLPAGTTLSLVNSANAATTFKISVDGSASTQTYNMPAGTYSATLSSVTTLERSGDAGPTTAVAATLSDPQPYQVVVTAGVTTSLVFHFTIAGTGGNLTFSTGSVATSVSVATNSGSATGVGDTFQLSLLAGGTSAGFSSDTAIASGALQATLTFTVTGTFVPAVSEVCAPIGNVTLSAGVSSTAYSFLSDSGSTGYLCFGDATVSPVLPAGFATFGAEAWNGNVAILLDSVSTYQCLFTGTLATDVYNDSTLALSSLASPSSLSVSSQIYANLTNYGYATVSGPATFQLLP